jgi:hypothetical protein
MTAAATLSRPLPGHRADYGNCGDPDYIWDEDRQSSRLVEKGVQEWSFCMVLENALLPGDSTNR